MSLDDGGAVSDVRADDLAASCVYIAHNVAHIFVGSRYDDLHDRLKQSRGLPSRMASLNAMLPQILNAISEESTSW